MANMSYCRFQNTLEALRDCEDALDDGVLISPGFVGPEREAAHELVRLCVKIAEYIELVPDAD